MSTLPANTLFYLSYGLLTVLVTWESFSIRRVLLQMSYIMRLHDERNKELAATRNGPPIGMRIPQLDLSGFEKANLLLNQDSVDDRHNVAFLFLDSDCLLHPMFESWYGLTLNVWAQEVDATVAVCFSGEQPVFAELVTAGSRYLSSPGFLHDPKKQISEKFAITKFPTLVLADSRGTVLKVGGAYYPTTQAQPERSFAVPP